MAQLLILTTGHHPSWNRTTSQYGSWNNINCLKKKRTFRVKVVKHFLKLFEKANEGRVLENNRNFNEKKMFTQSVYVSSEFSICCQKHLNAVPS